MNRLNILPTSRAIRAKRESYIQNNSLLPKFITIGEFENRAIVLDNKVLVDSKRRIVLLQEAAKFTEFKSLKSDLNLVKFYTQSQEFFSFFEELSLDNVDINELFSADYYAEFDRDLDILKKLIDNYKTILDSNGLTDRSFVPKEYRLNLEYINSFDSFYLELEGFLTNFEIELFVKIAKIKPFTIKMRSCEFNTKMISSFKNLGISIENLAQTEFDLSTKNIIKEIKKPLQFNCEVIETKERLEQIAVALSKIEEFVQSGIKPEKIALLVPDESMAELVKDFDKNKNFNLAMGYRYSKRLSYRALWALKEHLNAQELATKFLNSMNFDFAKLNLPNDEIGVNSFFQILKDAQLPLYKEDELDKKLDKLGLLKNKFKFCTIFKGEYKFKEWLHLWLSEIAEHTIDDISGGKVTIMGVLESRGVAFDAVVVLDFNEEVVPSVSKKDRFLNTHIREISGLPTKKDRESLQKYYYLRALEQAEKSVIIYHTQDGASSSKFLYELNLSTKINYYQTPLNTLFLEETNYKKESYLEDKTLDFNAKNYSWSATSLKVFLECKRKFYYKYIEGIAQPKIDELNEGTILHAILNNVLHKNVNFSTKEELKKALLKQIAKEESFDAQMPYKKVLWSKLLEPLIDEQFTHLQQGWAINATETKAVGSIGGLEFSGYIDRIDKKGEQYLVIDYKSGKVTNPKDTEKLTDFQMSIYQKLLDKPTSKIDFAYIKILEDGKLEYLVEQEQKEQKLLEHIEHIKSLKTFTTTKCENLAICRYCPYQLLCHRGEYL